MFFRKVQIGCGKCGLVAESADWLQKVRIGCEDWLRKVRIGCGKCGLVAESADLLRKVLYCTVLTSNM